MATGTRTRASLPANDVTLAAKYDRQIRIWGEQGQAALERASVCLINANAVGTETLKNLVLPGIGSFTVIDGDEVTHADHGTNFFLLPPSAVTIPIPAENIMSASKMCNKALAATAAMHELNDSVEGSYIPQRVSTFIRSEQEAFAFFRRFSAVIVTQMSTSDVTLKAIAAGCYKANVPLIVCRAYGLIGYIRIQARELCVLDTKEDDIAPDLRLCDPFEELESYVNSLRFQTMTDSTVASHVPFVVILVQAVKAFRQKHGGGLPKTRTEKLEFAEIVKSLRPKACPITAENFEEALKMTHMRLCFHGAEDIPHDVHLVLSDEKSDPNREEGLKAESLDSSLQDQKFPEVIRFSRRLNRRSSAAEADTCERSPDSETDRTGAERIEGDRASFWLHVSALRSFVKETGRLPVRGSLPDMAADTESYIALQSLYSAKAEADAKRVAKLGLELIERFGLDVEFDDISVRQFCKNATGIRVYQTRSIVEEVEGKDGKASGFLDAATSDMALEPSRKGSPAAYYALLRALDRFKAEHGRDAGIDDCMGETDLSLVWEYLNSVKEELGVTGTASLWRDEAVEVVRYAGGELHNVAAFVGGVAGQEVTKIVTRQFMPLRDTLMINFGEQSSVQFKA